MEYVRLGSSGVKVSRICLGMMGFGDPAVRPWVLPEADAEPIVREAVEAGVTFFDTADVYTRGASEQVTGRLLRRLFTRREDYVLATKVRSPLRDGPNNSGLSRKYIFAAIDDSLRRLGTDYVDLYQIHRWDYDTPIEETMAALHDVVRAGKVRYLGASSMFAWQFAVAQHTAVVHGWTRFVSMQNHYNLLYREEEREMIPLCRHLGVGVLPWSPLARGVLVGNRAGGQPRTLRARNDPFVEHLYDASDLTVVDRLSTVAAGRGEAPARIALAWLLSQPGVTAPVVGATRPGHIGDAVAAVDLTLSPEEVARLEEPYRPHPIRGHE